MLPPASVSTDCRREARMTPPNAASVEQITKPAMRTRSVAMPALREASVLPPTA